MSVKTKSGPSGLSGTAIVIRKNGKKEEVHFNIPLSEETKRLEEPSINKTSIKNISKENQNGGNSSNISP